MLIKLMPTVLVNALHIAAEQYDRDAATCRLDADRKLMPALGAERTAQQFERQAFEARRHAGLIAVRDTVESDEIMINVTGSLVHQFDVESKALRKQHTEALRAIEQAESSGNVRERILSSEDQ